MPLLYMAIPAGMLLGAVLGLLGGGGGLIAVPLFGAIFGWSIDDSGTASMACVLTGSAIAVIAQRASGRVRWRVGVTYGVLGVVGAIAGSLLAFKVPDVFQHVGLAGLLIVSGVLMLRKASRLRRIGPTPVAVTEDLVRIDVRLIAAATGIGLVVGMFGISGGFLTVPALVTLVGLSVPEATATALVVVMINSFVAISARGRHIEHVAPTVVLAISTAIGAIAGVALSRRSSAVLLATAFGSLMLAIAAWELHMAISG